MVNNDYNYSLSNLEEQTSLKKDKNLNNKHDTSILTDANAHYSTKLIL